MPAPESLAHDRHLTAGVDVGTGAIKVAIATSRAGEEGEVLATAVQRIRRRSVLDVIAETWTEALAAAGMLEDLTEGADPMGPESVARFHYVASTGDGDAVPFRTGHFYSMTTHARGALFLVPGAAGVIDVGALHARAIRMDSRGKVLAQRMTSQCASGSGQFVENIARYLGVPLEDVGSLSVEADAPEEVSSICAVLAETDVINMVSRGIGVENILRGIHLSIAGRLARLLKKIKVEGTVAITGGLARDAGMVAALVTHLDDKGAPTRRRKAVPAAPVEVIAHEHAMLAGAIGAALLGAYRYQQLVDQGRAELLAGTAAAPNAP